MPRLHLTVAIPTYKREQVLIESIERLLCQVETQDKILVVDQSPHHTHIVSEKLSLWNQKNMISWHRLQAPSITHAMNHALSESKNPIVIFLDDDIIPEEGLLDAHRVAYSNPNIWAVSGQVLQPGQQPAQISLRNMAASLQEDLDFPFYSAQRAFVTNVMAGNLSVRREEAISCGGFDENFRPPVAYRFETEFARRLITAGGRILFEPAASIHHLRASEGGTRSKGSHLTSASPVHGEGDYYYALRHGRGIDRFMYIIQRPIREIRTRFHLNHPWWIPIKFFGEIRALLSAIKLYKKGPKLIQRADFGRQRTKGKNVRK